MHKILWALLLTICLVGCCGCKLVEGLVKDVGTWDLSACVDGFDTCWELYSDNSEKFGGSFVDGMGTLFNPGG